MRILIKKCKLSSRLATVAVCAGVIYGFSIAVLGAGESVKEKGNFVNNTPKDQHLRDPFSEGNELYLPDAQGLNSSLSVAGIIIMASGEKMAVLNVPGFRKTFFVKENDVIQISSESGEKNSSSALSVSLKILKIHDSEILAAPVGDLNNTLIIR